MVQRKIVFTDSVESVDKAFGFVMDHLEQVGDDPSVKIRPVWFSDLFDSSNEMVREFEVTVSGVFDGEE